jgi:hypothetical protein
MRVLISIAMIRKEGREVNKVNNRRKTSYIEKRVQRTSIEIYLHITRQYG